MWFRLQIVLYALAISAWVAVRRLFRGPKRPGWSYTFECGVEIVRGIVRRGADRLHAGGSLSPLFVPSAPASSKRVRTEAAQLAGLPTEIHTATSFEPGQPTILYLHGGGYVTCSPATHRELTRQLAIAAGARCFVPNYRKAPAHVFPAAVDDAVACYREILGSGVAASTLFIAGDSAGGGLCLALLQRLREAGEPLPRAAILLSPWVDLTCQGETLTTHAEFDYLSAEMITGAAKLYASTTPLDHPHLSPINADLAGFPPLLVQTGGAEVFVSENLAFVERARAAGVDVKHELMEHMVHVFQAFVLVSSPGRDAIESAGRFVREQAGLPLPPTGGARPAAGTPALPESAN